MRHSDAVELLPDYALDLLDQDVTDAVGAHVAGCSSCRDWLEAHDLLVAGLSQSREHPDSETLALCAVRPEEAYELDRTDLRQHLETCARCRSEIEAVTAAVRDARPQAEPARAPVPSWIAAPALRWALAAAVAVIAIGGMTAVTIMLQTHPTVPQRAAATTARADGATTPPQGASTETRGVETEEITGECTIQTDDRPAIARMTIKNGADVTIRATDTVVFGNGFQVEPGARVRVATGS